MIDCNGAPDARKRLELPENGSQSLREKILVRTTSVVRRRRRMRRAAFGSALALCYVFGLGTMQAWHALSSRSAADSGNENIIAMKTDQAVKTTSQNNAGSEKQKASLKKPRPRQSQFEVLCRISDRYLYRDADTLEAIRGYRRALRVATPAELEICPQRDSWLLMALKQEYLTKENRDENRGV